MSSSGEVVSNQVVIFGGGVFSDELGRGQLEPWSTLRLDRAVDHYYDNQDRFEAEGATIVCTGWQTPGLIDLRTHASIREADVAADYLVRAGVPHELVEKERTSTNTLTNLLNALNGEYIKVEEMDVDNPLGVVSHPNHLKRVEMFAKGIGIPGEHIQRIPTKVEDHRLREFISRTAWRGVLVGTNSPDEMRRRYETVALSLGGIVPFARLHLSKLPL